MSARLLVALLAGLLLTVAANAEPAQQSGAMQGFQMNRDQPVKIESNTLEVRDKSQQATFMGSVKLTQGETILQCQTLVIFYEDNATPTGPKKAAPATATRVGTLRFTPAAARPPHAARGASAPRAARPRRRPRRRAPAVADPTAPGPSRAQRSCGLPR